MGAVLIVWGVVETLTVGWQGAPQIVLLAAFVVVPAALLIAIGRVSRAPADRAQTAG